MGVSGPLLLVESTNFIMKPYFIGKQLVQTPYTLEVSYTPVGKTLPSVWFVASYCNYLYTHYSKFKALPNFAAIWYLVNLYIQTDIMSKVE